MPHCLRNSLLVCFLLATAGCTPPLSRSVPGFKTKADGIAPDYSRLEYWAAHPDKEDPSDSIPEPLRAASHKEEGVDVFFLHPTTLTDPRKEVWNGDLSDSTLNKKTDGSTILYQASVFNNYRVFAPRYRQAHLRAYYSPDSASSRRAFDLAYGDLRSAFQYYLEHYNQGRPIIIASHSQGTTHAKRLLREFFDGKPLADRLVAAYTIGMAIRSDYFTVLQPCRDSLATGCVIDWRTFRSGYEPPWLRDERHPSIDVNPLTWTTTEEYAPAALNKGGILRNFNKLVPGDADAQCHHGILWASPHFPGSWLFRTKNFHIGDINLYYLNIRDNADARVRAWRRAHP